MENNINKIFKKRSCLSAEELEGYARNTLKQRERNHVERHLLDCELCSEALEGMLHAGRELNLVKMKSTLAHRFVATRNSENNSAGKNYTGWWIAAALVCIAAVSAVVWKFNNKPSETLAVVQVSDSSRNEQEGIRIKAKESFAEPESATEINENGVAEEVKRETAERNMSLQDASLAREGQNVEQPVVQEEVAAYEITADVKANDKPAAAQPEPRDMYGNAYKPSEAENYSSVSNQAALKKKNMETLSVSEPALSWNEIFRLAGNGQFLQALLSVDRLKQEKDELKKSYYKGFYLYKLERFDEAILQFEKLKNEKSNEFYYDALFYRAMSLISSGRNKEGKEILNRIVKDNLPHHEHATETLRLLD